MCRFRKKINKKIDDLQASLLELKKVIETNELNRLRQESLDLKEIKEQLSNIKIRVRTCNTYDDQETGCKMIKVVYDIPVQEVYFDENGNAKLNKTFKAINMLNLLSNKDYLKIQKNISKIKKS